MPLYQSLASYVSSILMPALVISPPFADCPIPGPTDLSKAAELNEVALPCKLHPQWFVTTPELSQTFAKISDRSHSTRLTCFIVWIWIASTPLIPPARSGQTLTVLFSDSGLLDHLSIPAEASLHLKCEFNRFSRFNPPL